MVMTRIVFSKIQNLDPKKASKIMGLLLIQDHSEKEMIRLAFDPEVLVHSVVLRARKELALPLNSPSTSPSSPSPFISSNPVPMSRQNSNPSRLINSGMSLPPPLSIPNPSLTTSTSLATLSKLQNPSDFMSPNNLVVGSSSTTVNTSSYLPYYGNQRFDCNVPSF